MFNQKATKKDVFNQKATKKDVFKLGLAMAEMFEKLDNKLSSQLDRISNTLTNQNWDLSVIRREIYKLEYIKAEIERATKPTKKAKK